MHVRNHVLVLSRITRNVNAASTTPKSAIFLCKRFNARQKLQIGYWPTFYSISFSELFVA